MQISREEAIAHRVAAQQLDRVPVAGRAMTDAAILDLGAQDSGRDGASWALANRGVPLANPGALGAADELALVWSLRVSPHVYRRAELVDVMRAISPYDEADALKRGGSPDAVATVAREMRTLVARPMVKGELSSALTERVPQTCTTWCRACQATHVTESLFRMAPLFAGLELEPATSPPVLGRIPGWPRRPAGFASDPDAAPERLQPIRAYLRLLGPATPAEVAGFLSTTATVVKQHWPEDAVEVRVAGKRKWLLGDLLAAEPVVRLLGPYDLLVQGGDRDLLVPDAAHRKTLWPMLGRPGPVLAAGEVAGWWRPRASAKKLDLEVELWRARAASKEAIGEQAERLAAHRELALGAIRFPS